MNWLAECDAVIATEGRKFSASQIAQARKFETSPLAGLGIKMDPRTLIPRPKDAKLASLWVEFKDNVARHVPWRARFLVQRMEARARELAKEGS